MHEYQSEDITTLAKALIQVQRNLQPAFKDATNPFTRSQYATLNSVMASCREALLDNSIWLCQHPVPVEAGYLGLVTKLTTLNPASGNRALPWCRCRKLTRKLWASS